MQSSNTPLVATDELQQKLTHAISGEVDFSTTRRAEYSSDASNYRRIPLGVVFPRTEQDIIKTVEICRSFDVAITLRGGGTSVAGNAIGDGVIIDCSRFYNRILEVDPERRVARVQPGVVLDDLQAATAKYGLRFGPDPSTHSRCTIGGMIGNNSCGARSVVFGRTSDNVVELDVLLYDGTRLTIGATTDDEFDQIIASGGRQAELYQELRSIRDKYEASIRSRMGQFRRQISGYSLEHLLPENDFNIAQAFVGTEGTCAIILSATVRLVTAPKISALVVLSFDDLAVAADAIPALLPYQPTAIEGVDASITSEDAAWLLVELSECNEALPAELARVTQAKSVRVAIDPLEQRAFWKIREDGAGLASRTPDGKEAWPGWEDAAVPPEQLGDYLRGFQELLRKHHLQGAIYGHFGEGCIHTRIDFNFNTTAGVADFRAFITEACGLAGKHGGSFSGEHGDGMARSEFLPLMYSQELIAAFRQFKHAWDPNGKLNPQIIVDPVRMDDHLRVDPRRTTIPVQSTFEYPHDNGDFAQAVRRCVGVGKCRSDAGGVMCPSYRATHDERDSTRGRARVLHEMLQGDVIDTAWRSTEARDALDLCLSCKGCKTDCPVNVDMSTYKSEFLYHHYEGRIRPASHYSLGWLPVWARAASLAPRLVNTLGASPLARPMKALVGVTHKRPLPAFAQQTFRNWFDKQAFPSHPERHRVLLWVDTFTNYFSPKVGQAAVRVLQAAGFDVILPPEKKVCCGLTWVSTGQLDTARKAMQKSLDTIDPFLLEGVPMVGLEPSCTAVFRSDIVELLGNNAQTQRAAQQTFTLAEFLEKHAADWKLPNVPETTITQTHCHQHAVMGATAEERVMKALGLNNTTLDSGCCGLAGNFGFESDHYDVSMAVAEQGFLPHVTASDPETLVISDGFSCRTQISQLTDKAPLHLAEVIAKHLD